MTSPRRRLAFPSVLLCTSLAFLSLATGCSSEKDAGAPAGSSPQAGEPAASGLAISSAGVNPPSGRTFTCWILGSGFQAGDKVLVNGTTEIPATFAHPGHVTFAGGVELLDGRAVLTLVVVRPGTQLRSNPVDAPIPAPNGG